MAHTEAYLQYGSASNLPMSTVKVELKEDLLPWQERGLQETASGYGLKLTSPYKVKVNGKWRRVYVCQISNAGTAYIGKPGAWEATVDLH